MKIKLNKKESPNNKNTFVAKCSMGSFSTGIKRSVKTKSHKCNSYMVKPCIIK